MIEVTPAANQYLNDQMMIHRARGLKLHAINPGSPAADCELTYLLFSEIDGSDLILVCSKAGIYVEPSAMPYLEGALIDFHGDRMGGELSIKAPNLKGREPAEDAPLQERVQWVLDSRINPMVASHGGRVALDRITDDNIVMLRFGGGCHGCGMVDVTLKQGIETTLKEAVPEIAGVADATDHSTGTEPYYPGG